MSIDANNEGSPEAIDRSARVRLQFEKPAPRADVAKALEGIIGNRHSEHRFRQHVSNISAEGDRSILVGLEAGAGDADALIRAMRARGFQLLQAS